MNYEIEVKKASYTARAKIHELRSKWMEEFPTTVDQTFYQLVMDQLDTLQVLVRLAGEVKE